MHFSDSEKESLRLWLIDYLVQLGDSSTIDDAEVLTDYALALLERDMEIENHKNYIIRELEAFVTDSKALVSQLFAVIKDGSYQGYDESKTEIKEADEVDHPNVDDDESRRQEYDSKFQVDGHERYESTSKNEISKDENNREESRSSKSYHSDNYRKRRNDSDSSYYNNNRNPHHSHRGGFRGTQHFPDIGRGNNHPANMMNSFMYPNFGYPMQMFPTMPPGLPAAASVPGLPIEGIPPSAGMSMFSPYGMYGMGMPAPMYIPDANMTQPNPYPSYHPGGPRGYHNNKFQKFNKGNLSFQQQNTQETQVEPPSMGYKKSDPTSDLADSKDESKNLDDSNAHYRQPKSSYVPTKPRNPMWKTKGWNSYSMPAKDVKPANEDADGSTTLSENVAITSINETNDKDSEHDNVATAPTPATGAITKENIIVQHQYDTLKKLRGEVDDIWKKKENILQSHIDKIREITSKLESANNTDSRELLDNLEGKLMKLQEQLREVKDQRSKGIVSQQIQQEVEANSFPFYRGRGRGGYPHAPRGRFASSGRFSPRGRRGRFGGRFSGRWQYSLKLEGSTNDAENYPATSTLDDAVLSFIEGTEQDNIGNEEYHDSMNNDISLEVTTTE